MNLRPASAEDAPRLAEAHASAFDPPWTDADIRGMLGSHGAFALAADTSDGAIAGFVLCRAIAGEAEILTIAVRPEHRRRGVAQALVEAAACLAAPTCEALFLEVAADNPGAIALYDKAGFEPVGRRAGYYGRAGRGSIDAIVMRRTLNR